MHVRLLCTINALLGVSMDVSLFVRIHGIWLRTDPYWSVYERVLLLKIYEFETLYEFGYVKDPATVHSMTMNQITKLDHYSISDGRNTIWKRKFKSYRYWQSIMQRDGEVYFEIYGGQKGESERFLGIVKIVEFVTAD